MKTMMKSATISTLALVAALALADPVRVTVNGNPIDFESAQPTMIQGHVYVPLRSVFEAIGATVDWEPDTQSVIANGHGRHVKLQIGSMDASINDHVRTMDTPPVIIEDTTMVPLRFLSESLGGHVDWLPENNLVAIRSGDDGAAQHFTPAPPVSPPAQTVILERPAPPPVIIERPAPPPPPPPAPPLRIERYTVIPMRLDEQLTSNNNHPGDRVTARVVGDQERYMGLPEGTLVVGRVFEANAASGSHGGVLDVRFTHLRLPDGREYAIHGLVTPLNDKMVERTSSGRWMAKEEAGKAMRFDSGPGEGSPLVLDPYHPEPVGGSAVGGTAGQVLGIFDRRMAHNVIFAQGTRLGLILDKDLEIAPEDIK